jgi:LysM repeat protein
MLMKGLPIAFPFSSPLVTSLLFAAIATGGPLATAQAPPASESAAAAAARLDTEERLRRLATEVEDLKEANALLQRRLADFNAELQRMSEEHGRAQSSFATRQDLNQLVEKLREIDRKRESDSQRVLESLDRLAKRPPALPAAAPAPRAEPERTEKPPESSPERRGYEYTIKADDTLSAILQAYREKGVKTSLKQVLDANPTLNPNKLRVGQKVFIPDPSQS